MATPRPLWSVTPLLYSDSISQRLDCDVYLKLENLQPSKSFKYRGISLFIQEALKSHGPNLKIVIASGGNAGLAAAYAAKTLAIPCTVYMPLRSSSMVPVLEALGATVITEGIDYEAALWNAKKAVKNDPHSVVVPAFDHPTIWKGHSSMIEEIKSQLPEEVRPNAIFCSVGGGGLVGGVIIGCQTVGWDDVPLVTLETKGADCWYCSLLCNDTSKWGRPTAEEFEFQGLMSPIRESEKLIYTARLSKIDTRASSLGAKEPSEEVVKMALDRPGPIALVRINDEMAMQAALSFADDHKMLVELACSTTLTPAYMPGMLGKLDLEKHFPPGTGSASTSMSTQEEPSERKKPVLVFIVCGGANVSLEELSEYRGLLKSKSARTKKSLRQFWVDGWEQKLNT
ncbi:hypothetical protein FRC02_006369 [Tulasnella sp. 418]|nr:hypothetical protein FRC02_006369 [Tulasnella sp. 418]